MTTPERDTIELSDFLFDQTYGASDANTVLLAFPKEKLKNKKLIEINIAECGFATGNLKFSFEKEDLDDVPGTNVSLSQASFKISLITF